MNPREILNKVFRRVLETPDVQTEYPANFPSIVAPHFSSGQTLFEQKPVQPTETIERIKPETHPNPRG